MLEERGNIVDMNFEKSIFKSTYTFSSSRAIIRILSDAFSKQNCDTVGAVKYAVIKTEGRCIYCGEAMYEKDGETPIFSNTIHYDHVYPASKLNLFELGNIAIACASCNLEKSDRFPMDYYDIRAASCQPLYYSDRKTFEKFLNDFTLPYKIKWPDYYDVGTVDIEDEDELKNLLFELFYDKVPISATSSKYNHDNSVNREFWNRLVEKAFETYRPMTAKDVEGRIGYANDVFEKLFKHDTNITDISMKQLRKFINTLLEEKKDSKNEFQKYRMLIKILIEILKEDLVDVELDDLYTEVPTYSKFAKQKSS